MDRELCTYQFYRIKKAKIVNRLKVEKQLNKNISGGSMINFFIERFRKNAIR